MARRAPSIRPGHDREPVAPDAPVQVRFLAPSEAAALTECVERCYGSTYDATWVYDPAEIRRRLESGVLRSVVGVAGGDVVGHLALARSAPGAPVGEAGQAVVDPRYRSHHLFTTLKQHLARWAATAGILGMYSEATAAHPYSQKANLALGASETGFLLGYIPASVDYVGIEKAAGADRRQSAALFYLATNDPPPEQAYPPRFHVAALGGLYEHVGLPREIRDADVILESATELRVHVDPRHNDGVITVTRPGSDLVAELGARVAELDSAGVDCVYLDLPLADPATASLSPAVHHELGFFFGGVIPEVQDGDVLRLQRLNGVDAEPSDVAVASDFGRALLDYVFERKADVAINA